MTTDESHPDPSPASKPEPAVSPAPAAGAVSPIVPPEEADESLPWQPFTLRSVAAFARAPLGRLWLVQWVAGCFCAALIAWFFHTTWFPRLGEAADKLPAHGEIVAGRLNWPYDPRTLVQGRFLSLTVNPGTEDLPDASDVQVVFSTGELRFRSFFGWVSLPYPKALNVGLNRADVVPWWGAWRPVILSGIFLAALVGLWGSWLVLSLPYSGLAWGLAALAHRNPGWWAAWKLTGAALLPGALVMTAGIGLYGCGWLDLLRVFLVFILHLLVGWAYLVGAVFFLPRTGPAAGPASPGADPGAANPFNPNPDPEPPVPGKGENPFAAGRG